MRQQSVACRRLERDEFVQSEKRALCGAFLSILALIGAAILAVLSLPPSGILGLEPDLGLVEEHPMPVALAVGDLERDAPEQSFATGGPEFSYADASHRRNASKVTESGRTPFARMLASVIGGPRKSKRGKPEISWGRPYHGVCSLYDKGDYYITESQQREHESAVPRGTTVASPQRSRNF
jgi:hypothetical protein